MNNDALGPHVTAAILSVGDELAIGQTLDTNSRWLSTELFARGVAVREHATVADDVDALRTAIERLAAGYDLLVITGGLGPTADDLTRVALAAAMGETLVEDAAALAEIETWFAGRGRDMPVANRVQALRPVSAVCLANPHGTAPGLSARIGSCDVLCLPGPPREMTPMFEADVAPRLRVDASRIVRTRVLATFGRGESDIAQDLGALMDRDRNPLVGTTASGGIVSCRLRYEGAGPSEAADAALAETETEVRLRLGSIVLDAEPGPNVLVADVLARLQAAGQSVAVVESCTGGLLGMMLTELPGSSKMFAGGWITYAYAMKSGQVGVSAEVLERVGAVSREVATAMAEGGLARGEIDGVQPADPPRPVDHCLAITGVAGPDGGSERAPVGTVWIALASRGKPLDVRRFRFRGGRDNVRERSARSALGILRQRLMGESGTLLAEWPADRAG